MSSFAKDTNVPTNDTISRQSAIDAILHNQEVYSNNFGDDPIDKYTTAIISNDVQTIVQLPSAQPEITRCKDCKHGIDYYHEGDCYCSNPKWGLKYFGGSWEFYCADAERRTDE